MRAAFPSFACLTLGGALLVTACDLVPGSGAAPGDRGAAPPRRPTLTLDPPATSSPPRAAPAPSSRAASVVTGVIPADPSPSDDTPSPNDSPSTDDPAPIANLQTPRLLVRVEDGGCSLVGADAKYLYARAPSCKEVLRVERATGTLESKKLGAPMLVQTVVDGAAYGCPLGDSKACALTRVPLEGGPTKLVATLPGFVDNANSGHGALLAGVFAPIGPDGHPDFRSGHFTLETVDLQSGARAVVAGPVGVGRVALTPAGLFFEGARTPTENVRAPSWGLWLHANGAPPRRLFRTHDASSISADDHHVYTIGMPRTLLRTTLDGARTEQLTTELASPATEANRLGISPAVRVTSDAIYVSTASTKGCMIWQIPKP